MGKGAKRLLLRLARIKLGQDLQAFYTRVVSLAAKQKRTRIHIRKNKHGCRMRL